MEEVVTEAVVGREMDLQSRNFLALTGLNRKLSSAYSSIKGRAGHR